MWHRTTSEWFTIKFYLILYVWLWYAGLEGCVEGCEGRASNTGPFFSEHVSLSFLLSSLLLQAAMSSRSYAVSNPNFSVMALRFTSTITPSALSPQIQATVVRISFSGCKKETMTEISNIAMTHSYFKRRKSDKQKSIE